MGHTEKIMLAILGFLTVTTVDAWSLNTDLVNSPFLTRLQFSMQKYLLAITFPVIFLWIAKRRGQKE